jgi:hypothetical protein
MLNRLLAASRLVPLEALPVAISEHVQTAGFSQVAVYVRDLQGSVLRLLGSNAPAPAGTGTTDEPTEMPLEGTVAGRAFQHGQILTDEAAGDGPRHWWVPVLDGTERVGVMRVTTARDDAFARGDIEALAALLGTLVVSKASTSDAYARLERTRPMTVAAELQWHQMPPRTYVDGRVAVAAALEPAYEISGDAYDYATDGPTVHLSIFDAMGHDPAAGLTATLAIGAYRNARRQGADLPEAGQAVEKTLLERYGGARYVTAILGRLDSDTGELEWVNYGHHLPVIIRGNRWIARPQCPPSGPMGMALGMKTTVCRERLEPGDRIVLYTDGITEARGPGDVEFGLERFTDLLIRHHADGLPVPETLRRVVNAVLEHHDGHLQDDATVLLCEWLGTTSADYQERARLAGLPPDLPSAVQDSL